MNELKAYKTEVSGAIVVEPDVFGDNRGWFMESYSKRKLAEVGIDVDFVVCLFFMF